MSVYTDFAALLILISVHLILTGKFWKLQQTRVQFSHINESCVFPRCFQFAGNRCLPAVFSRSHYLALLVLDFPGQCFLDSDDSVESSEGSNDLLVVNNLHLLSLLLLFFLFGAQADLELAAILLLHCSPHCVQKLNFLSITTSRHILYVHRNLPGLIVCSYLQGKFRISRPIRNTCRNGFFHKG